MRTPERTSGRASASRVVAISSSCKRWKIVAAAEIGVCRPLRPLRTRLEPAYLPPLLSGCTFSRQEETLPRSAVSRRAAEAADPVEGSSGRSSARVVAALEALTRSEEGLGLAELSLAVGAPKSSLLGILRSLAALGYLAHSHGLYRLGPRPFRPAAGMLPRRRRPPPVPPVFQDLQARPQETGFLVHLDPGAPRVTYV